MTNLEKLGLNYNEHYTASFEVEEVETLTEKKFGSFSTKRKTLDIYINPEQSGKPHFHVVDSKSDEVVRVLFEKSEYKRDNYDKTNGKVLNSDERQSLEKYLSEKTDGITRWELFARIWNNMCGPKNKVDISKTQPNYSFISEPKK